MKTQDTLYGDTYAAVRMIYYKSPGRSWQRLNSALQDALTAAITAHLSFLPDDFGAIVRDMNGGYWMGRSVGSTCGERYYTLAVKMGHTPACVSFERYADRPAALWSEDVKTPSRLCIGSDLTWNGERLHVTNMKRSELIACAYGPNEDDPLAAGCIRHFDDGYRIVERVRVVECDKLSLRLSAPVASPKRKARRIVHITYDQLTAARKAADTIRKRMLREIEATTKEELRTVMERISAERKAYRRCDILDFQKAIQDRERALREARGTVIEAIEAPRETPR
jgi:hypothetical protein